MIVIKLMGQENLVAIPGRKLFIWKNEKLWKQLPFFFSVFSTLLFNMVSNIIKITWEKWKIGNVKSTNLGENESITCFIIISAKKLHNILSNSWIFYHLSEMFPIFFILKIVKLQQSFNWLVHLIKFNNFQHFQYVGFHSL